MVPLPVAKAAPGNAQSATTTSPAANTLSRFNVKHPHYSWLRFQMRSGTVPETRLLSNGS